MATREDATRPSYRWPSEEGAARVEGERALRQAKRTNCTARYGGRRVMRACFVY